MLIFIQLGQCLGKENDLIGFLMRGQTFLGIFNSTFFVSNLYLNISIIIVAIIGLIIFFIANKIFPWLLVSTTVFLFITYAFIYNGAFWHYFFIYIYFIASLWLVYQRKKDLKLKILPQILLGAISILLVFWSTNPKYYDYIYNYNYGQIAQQISQDVNLSKSKLVGVYMLPESLGPYLQNKNMEIYYMCSARPYLKFYETRNRCLYGQEVNFNVLDKNYDKDGTFLLLSSDYSPNDNFYRIYSNNYVDYYDLILYKFIEDIAIFKIIKSK